MASWSEDRCTLSSRMWSNEMFLGQQDRQQHNELSPQKQIPRGTCCTLFISMGIRSSEAVWTISMLNTPLCDAVLTSNPGMSKIITSLFALNYIISESPKAQNGFARRIRKWYKSIDSSRSPKINIKILHITRYFSQWNSIISHFTASKLPLDLLNILFVSLLLQCSLAHEPAVSMQQRYTYKRRETTIIIPSGVVRSHPV